MATNPVRAIVAGKQLQAIAESIVNGVDVDELRTAVSDIAEQLLAPRSIVINETEYSMDDLTFGEQIKLRDYCRVTSGYEHAQPAEVTFPEFMPALATVIHQRANPAFDLETDGYALTWDDVVPDVAEGAEGEPADEAPAGPTAAGEAAPAE